MSLERAVYASSESCEWSTPQNFFEKLNQQFHFEVDVCATDDNAKCARYFTAKENGLVQE